MKTTSEGKAKVAPWDARPSPKLCKFYGTKAIVSTEMATTLVATRGNICRTWTSLDIGEEQPNPLGNNFKGSIYLLGGFT